MLTRQERRLAERLAAKQAAQDASGHTARALEPPEPAPITEESERRRIEAGVKWALRKGRYKPRPR